MLNTTLRLPVAITFILALTISAALAQAIHTYALPAELSYPEGIAHDAAAGAIYTVASADGTVVRTDLKSGASRVIAGPGVVLPVGNTIFPGILGLKLDGHGRLWMAGGATGKVFVLDTKSGKLLKTIATPGTGGLLNDLVIIGGDVYVTDTLRGTLWRISMTGNGIGEAQAWMSFAGTPIAYASGPNLNGIAQSPDGKTLFVVQMNKGLVFTIDVASRAIAQINLGKETVTGGDGLVLDGDTLYVVRQPEAEIVTIALSADRKSGKVISRVKDSALVWPATAVKVGSELLVVNAQFNKRPTNNPAKPFRVTAVPLSRLQGR